MVRPTVFDSFSRGRAPERDPTVRDWLREHPPPSHAFRQTIAAVAGRVASGEPFLVCVREFLDEFTLRPDDTSRARALAERPAPTGDARHDAFLGGLAEHLAVRHDMEAPPWTNEPGRFLDRFWFISPVAGFRAIAIAEAPAALRRRGIFVPARSLERV